MEDVLVSINRSNQSNILEINKTENIEIWKWILETLLGYKKEIDILDIGIDTIFLAFLLSEIGYRVKCIDHNIELLDIANKEALYRGLKIDFLSSKIESLPFDEYSLDTIVTCNLTSLTDADKSFKGWYRVLKFGGTVLNFIKLDNNFYHDYISEHKFIIWFKNAGFKKIETLRLPLELNNNVRPWVCIRCEK